MITSTLDNRNNPFRDMGQPPPELVRDTILQQDAQFREQVGFVFQLLHQSFSHFCMHYCYEKG